MPAVKTRVLTAGLYLKKNELRLEIVEQYILRSASQPIVKHPAIVKP